MASEKYKSLIRCGPFRGLDADTASEFIGESPAGAVAASEGDGAGASNVNSNRIRGGLTLELGRSTIVKLTNYSQYSIGAVVPYAVGAADQQYIMALEHGNTPVTTYYDPASSSGSGAAVALPPSYVQQANGQNGPFDWDQGVQFGEAVYLNSGHQYSYLNPSTAYTWQQAAPNPQTQGYNIAQTTGTLPQQAFYYYCFTFLVKGPNGAFVQETTPYGAVPNSGPPPPTFAYPYSYQGSNADSTHACKLTGTFAGTFPDGSTYTTNIYRQSVNVPVWTLVTNQTTNTPYIDNNTDTQISANQQLLLNQDPPPLYPLGDLPAQRPAIFVHQNRIWVFANVFSQGVGQFPPTAQCQLWYSDYAVPWRFNALAQEAGGSVLVVGNDATTSANRYSGYGDYPVNGVSLGGLAILFKHQTTWLLTGLDPSEFFVQKSFDIGCISRRSVILALGQVWWLSESGAYVFGGNGPEYLSAKVRALLATIPYNDQSNAVSTFSHLTWYISFPATGITLAYYTPTRDWFTLPYATNAAASIPSNPAVYAIPFSQATGQPNEVVAARPNSNILDNWFVGENDLNLPNTGTWLSPLTSSGAPHIEKTYDYITVLAPIQQGTCVWTLTIDPLGATPKVQTGTFNLAGDGPQFSGRHIARLSEDHKGFQAQLSLQITNTLGATTPIVIYRADVWGTFERALVLPA